MPTSIYGPMGVLVLDVPNFSVINSTRGFECGHADCRDGIPNRSESDIHGLMGLFPGKNLVRGIDGYGNIVKSEQFVEEMERNGQIRDLDYFMLENVLRQMSGWEDKWYPPITVSVNISRNTLFSPPVLMAQAA